ncbi:MAG: hypothetical protein ABI435_01740 [Pseudolysinimonas sp.]
MLPLTPKYSEKQHGVYVEAIEEALADKSNRVRNIALSGSYGVGKSSILQRVAELHFNDVISVSLSSLGFADEESLASGSTTRVASSTTNRIQKEIVKQLLYTVRPGKMPGSRYRRTTRLRLGRAVVLAFFVAIPVVILAFLVGWTASFSSVLRFPSGWELLIHVVVWLVSAALIFGLITVVHNRVQVQSLTAGTATIALSPKSATYFDEYLDEIVYFFEVVQRNIVIFEDIDRFDSAHIFETLRSLNEILNGASQLTRRRIVFIYAIKDSIFEELGARAAREELEGDGEGRGVKRTSEEQARFDAAELELARSNRTKFFDLVIPVVPFITHRSARDLLMKTMKGMSHSVSPDLFDVAARHVADMRLLKNVRNEFAVFRNRVIKQGGLKLREDALFAMVLYKSTHLSDFEQIKLGRSDLDDLYRDWRLLVNTNLSRLRTLVAGLRKEQVEQAVAIGQGPRLGPRLRADLERYARVFNRDVRGYTFRGEPLLLDRLDTDRFWEELATSGEAIVIRYREPGSGGTQESLLSREDIADIVEDPLRPEKWKQADAQRIRIALEQARESSDFLATADMASFFERPDLTVDLGGQALTFDDLTRKHLKSELARQLLRSRYIDRNFTLYTSTFYSDRVSVNATNFILQHVDAHFPDTHFALSAKEVRTVLRERGRSLLREKVAYNVSIMNFLLRHDIDDARLVAAQLSADGDAEKEFNLAYLQAGAEIEGFVGVMAARWARVFDFLVSGAGLEGDVRRGLVNAAVAASVDSVPYQVDDAVRDYLTSEIDRFPVLSDAAIAEDRATHIAALLNRFGVEVNKLAALAPRMRDAVVNAGAYKVSRENLLVALGGAEEVPALDTMRATHEVVYRRVLADLPSYRSAIVAGNSTITDGAAFAAVIEDIRTTDSAQLAPTIESASADCVIADISEVSDGLWEALAAHSRFPVTFKNVSAYLAALDLDRAIATAMASAKSIAVDDDDDLDSRIDLAKEILSAAAELPSATLRAELVGSLGLEGRFPSALIPTEQGELVGSLIAENVVSDSAETFAMISKDDVPGLAHAMKESKAFLTFMSTTQIPPDRVASVLKSPTVPSGIKHELVARFDEFTPGVSASDLTIVARYVLANGLRLSYAQGVRLATEGVGGDYVVALIRPHLDTLGLPVLAAVLTALGGEYALMIEQNGKRPRMPDTEAHRSLANRLVELDVAKSVSDKEVMGEIRVNMKRPPD